MLTFSWASNSALHFCYPFVIFQGIEEFHRVSPWRVSPSSVFNFNFVFWSISIRSILLLVCHCLKSGPQRRTRTNSKYQFFETVTCQRHQSVTLADTTRFLQNLYLTSTNTSLTWIQKKNFFSGTFLKQVSFFMESHEFKHLLTKRFDPIYIACGYLVVERITANEVYVWNSQFQSSLSN